MFRRAFTRLNSYLAGWPDGLLTLALVVAAGALVVLALRASAVEKAAALAWVVLP